MYALQCVQPGLNYFHQHLNGCLQSPLAAFKAARLFLPQKVQQMQPDILSVDSLASFPFLNIPSILSALKAELPQYVASTEDLAASYDPLRWWKENESVLPTWATCARKVLVVQPSSAAAERVFSLLKSSFSERQGQSLQDYLETSLMLQYNKH